MSSTTTVQTLDDIAAARFLRWDYLGRDIRLVDGDLAFGGDGDLLAHAEPVISFGEVLRYKSQVAASLVPDSIPSRIHIAIRAAINAILDDPRVKSVKIMGGDWRVVNDGVEPPVTDTKFYVANVSVGLTSGDTIENLVLPVRFEES